MIYNPGCCSVRLIYRLFTEVVFEEGDVAEDVGLQDKQYLIEVDGDSVEHK